MASKTSPPTDGWLGQRLDHGRFATVLAEARAAAGEPEMPRNSGARRTESKRALLAAIEKAAGRW